MNILKTSIAGLAIAAAVALPLVGTTAAFAGDAYFAPTAVDDEYWMTQGTSYFIDGGGIGVIANDYTGDSGDLLIDVMSYDSAILGLSSLGYFTYTPDPSFVGDAIITYTIKDTLSGLSSNTATIVIHVAAAPAPLPVANPDSYSTPQDTPLVVDVAFGLLSNDTDVWQMYAQDNTVGSLTMNPAGDFSFTPPAGFVGTVTFNYTAKDSSMNISNSAVVTIEVTAATISTIPSNPNPGNPGNPDGSDDSDGSDGQLATLAYTGTDDVTVWLVAPALALLALGGIGVWFARRRSVQL
ncbi:hypothetical protein BH11ACT5_BH11ACT5_21190 [soil metagenome]